MINLAQPLPCVLEYEASKAAILINEGDEG